MSTDVLELQTMVKASHHEAERRVIIDQYDKNQLWLSIVVPGGTTSLVLSFEEVQAVIDGMKMVMDA